MILFICILASVLFLWHTIIEYLDIVGIFSSTVVCNSNHFAYVQLRYVNVNKRIVFISRYVDFSVQQQISISNINKLKNIQSYMLMSSIYSAVLRRQYVKNGQTFFKAFISFHDFRKIYIYDAMSLNIFKFDPQAKS